MSPFLAFNLGSIFGLLLGLVLPWAWNEFQDSLMDEPNVVNPPVPGCDCSVCREERRRRATTIGPADDHA